MTAKRILPPLHDVIIETDFLENCDKPVTASKGVISLRNLAAIQTMIYSVDWRTYRYQLPSDIVTALECSSPYYNWTSEKDRPLLDRPHRREIKIPTLKVYLSAATLVVGRCRWKEMNTYAKVNCSSFQSPTIWLPNGPVKSMK